MHKLLDRKEWIVRSLASHFNVAANDENGRKQVFIQSAFVARVLLTHTQIDIQYYAYEDAGDWQAYLAVAYFMIHPSEKPLEEEVPYKLAAE